MNRSLLVSSRAEPGLRLRAIVPADLEDLRIWKNANKAAFFFQDEITPAMQRAWHEGYLRRPDDFMFMVERGGEVLGCLGFRLLKDGSADAYNIMAKPGASGRGAMGAAMVLMCSFIQARFTKHIGCLVVKGNAAARYYARCGYRAAADGGDHVVFKLDAAAFRPVEFNAAEGA
ncbi:MAG: GNAT family N-acetyltransferase [Elusimicrobia bacterium]|nr:GNAT family N-acetyltransferase [Elusimicrobiota bacterium]